ncbi:MAG: nucleoside hydrolase, partial [Lachnospiraceae bacterium]|nr:nucleoside hydrolase [Lachnospiraceae bacterium]
LTPRPPKKATETPTEPPTETPTDTPATEAATPTPTQAASDEFDEDSRECKNMILDMDFSTDVDDVVALRIATQLHKSGRINLLAVMSSVQGEDVCKAMHALLGYDGLPDVPIGMSVKDVPSNSPYWQAFIEEYYDEDGYSTKDSVSLYKQKIRECAARGEKVRIVTTGFLVNIEELLRDEPGYELVKEHVDAIWIVGGAYPNHGTDYNFWYTEDSIRAAIYVNDNCPVKLVYSTDQTAGQGNDHNENRAIKCGKYLTEKDPSGKDPVNLAFRRYESYYGVRIDDGHIAWDPMCVWAAALTREECRIKLSEVNTVIYEDGSNTFTPGPNPLRKIIARTSEDFDWYETQLDAWIYRGIKK